MTPLAAIRSVQPGGLVVAACTVVGFLLARLPILHVLSPLVLALLAGVVWRSVVLRGGSLGRFAPGARLAAGPLLKLGIVALGVRLDVRAVVSLGPWLLLGSVIGALAAFVVAELVGRRAGVPPDLRRVAGVGTAICGASAIVAAGPVLRSSPTHVSAAVGAISLLGTLGVIAFALWDAVADVAAVTLGRLAGATLQEVGQVVAAGSVAGPEGADVALLVKLSRVVLLAPALLALAAWASRASTDQVRGGARERRPHVRWPVPPFVIGFLAAGAVVSAGWVDEPVVRLASEAGTIATAAAMAGIGLGVDVRAVRGPGAMALIVSAASFAALVLTMAAYYALLA